MKTDKNVEKFIKTHFEKENILRLKVIPNSRKQKILLEDDSLVITLKSPPEENKANIELLNIFEKIYNYKLSFKITTGKKNKTKTIKIIK